MTCFWDTSIRESNDTDEDDSDEGEEDEDADISFDTERFMSILDETLGTIWQNVFVDRKILTESC